MFNYELVLLYFLLFSILSGFHSFSFADLRQITNCRYFHMRIEGWYRHVQYINSFFLIISLFSILADFSSWTFGDLRQKTKH